MPRRLSTPETPAAPIEFAGPPHRLRLLSSLALDAAEISLEPEGLLSEVIAGQRKPFRLRGKRPGADATQLRVRLDRTTPPGTYQAALSTGTTRYPVQIRVDPSPRLRITPAEIVFEAEPEGEALAVFTLANKGNVPVEIPETTFVGIFDDDGIESAFASTYRLDTDDVNKLLANLLSGLREGHGGLLKIRVVSGAGKLLPGECGSVTMKADLPTKLKPGHFYHGVWSLETLNASVRVIVRKSPRAHGARQ